MFCFIEVLYFMSISLDELSFNFLTDSERYFSLVMISSFFRQSSLFALSCTFFMSWSFSFDSSCFNINLFFLDSWKTAKFAATLSALIFMLFLISHSWCLLSCLRPVRAASYSLLACINSSNSLCILLSVKRSLLFFFFSASANFSFLSSVSSAYFNLKVETLLISSEFSMLKRVFLSLKIVDCIILDDLHLLSILANDSLNVVCSSNSLCSKFDFIASLLRVYLIKDFSFSKLTLAYLCINDYYLLSCFLSYSCIL